MNYPAADSVDFELRGINLSVIPDSKSTLRYAYLIGR
jgi:hypothetical protein